jgi:hypothetical protein
MTDAARPLPLAETLRQFAGSWVAVDRRTGRAVEAADSPYALSAKLRERGLKNVAIVRAPDENDPELVGLG